MDKKKEKRADHSNPATEASSSEAIVADSADMSHAEQIPSYQEATSGSSGGMPTIDSPFTFPTDSRPPPSYEAKAQAAPGFSSSFSYNTKPIAIPQVAPDPASHFLSAYPHDLLSHGITQQAWHAFVDTTSAFLTAKVSDRAIAHAGDMAKSLGAPPKQYGRNIAAHAKTVGKQIARDAKRFNILGLASSVVGGAVSIPVQAALGAVHTVLAIPGTAVAAVSQTPRTPLQRAATYAAVASKNWLNQRGLHAVLLDTRQLADMVRVPTEQFLGVAAEGAGKTGSAAGMMSALCGHIQPLQVLGREIVVLSTQTLWLVVVPVGAADVDDSK
ncbi:hypothetical protein E4U17_004495 [Claviceps sp. LM77 group G4]|nr:hypothetical protein E4U17_004495 [Claviceps sp. LM77 group G4]KAG6075101.1 hypothetical protein E4U16_003599 [Claviceps sp. LM84 group G4]KAG6083594.1 hypothetical protein E4U33_004602 [Claviceps sp. LM78 group G4]